jgi:hypothetical protein
VCSVEASTQCAHHFLGQDQAVEYLFCVRNVRQAQGPPDPLSLAEMAKELWNHCMKLSVCTRPDLWHAAVVPGGSPATNCLHVDSWENK